MNKLKETIINDIKTAMKEKDTVTRDVLRIIKGEIERKEDGTKELSTGEIVGIIKKLIESSETTGDKDEVNVLEKYLPKQMDANQLEVIVNELKASGFATSVKDMGKVMQYFKTNHEGTYDGKVLSEIIRKILP